MPPRQSYPPRTSAEGVLYPGHPINPQNNYNRMLQGPVHAGSSLPSQQGGSPPRADPRISNFRMFQQAQAKNGQAMGNIAAQQQLAFATANNQPPRQPGRPFAYGPGWSAAGNSVNGGSQNGPSQPPMAGNGMPPRFPINGTGADGNPNLGGRVLFQEPAGTALLFRNNATQVGNANGKPLCKLVLY